MSKWLEYMSWCASYWINKDQELAIVRKHTDCPEMRLSKELKEIIK